MSTGRIRTRSAPSGWPSRRAKGRPPWTTRVFGAGSATPGAPEWTSSITADSVSSKMSFCSMLMTGMFG
eukprot:15456182-Alexandrium_andersonii.AAC.1